MIQGSDIYEYLVARGCTDRLLTHYVDDNPDWIELFHLDSGWLVAPLWLPVTADGFVFLSFSGVYHPRKYDFCFEPQFEAALRSVRSEPLRDVFVLGGEFNHFHLLMDFLPRLYLFSAVPELAQRRIVVGADLTGQQLALARRILERAGVPAPRFQSVSPGIHRLEDAFVPGTVARGTAAAIWNRHFFPRSGGGGPERLFVLRESPRRRLLNQEAIAAHLARLGFHCAEPAALSFEEQVNLFSSARVVVGAHGAALTNLLFAPEGGVAIELYVNVRQPHFLDIATVRKIRHVYLAGTPAAGGEGTHNDDFTIELEALTAQLPPFL